MSSSRLAQTRNLNLHMAIDRQSSALPPAQPSYILRGHASQIHSVEFVRQNTRLLTSDAEGWVVFWKVETKRALAVWKAHDGAILGTAEWGRDKIITHGRDNNLRIWQLRSTDESSLSAVLPAEHATTQRPKPWLLHTLPVNTLNFCAFSMCHAYSPRKAPQPDLGSVTETDSSSALHESILIAVPARDDKKVEVYQLPEERLRYIVPRAQSADTGMVMAVKLAQHPISNNHLLLVGYEGGLTAVFRLPRTREVSSLGAAEVIYLSQPHSQPILSLEISPDGQTYFTSSADAIIAAHRIPALPVDAEDNDGQSQKEDPQSTNISMQKAREHVSGSPHTTEAHEAISTAPNSALKATASSANDSPLSFAKQSIASSQVPGGKPAGLSTLLSSSTTKHTPMTPSPPPPEVTTQPPCKIIDTKHAGQQSLCVRSDGRLIATGGWDTRIRIYSAKTLKEVAVLKWHKEGVYAVDFGAILDAGDLENNDDEIGDQGGELVQRMSGLGKLQRQREEKMQIKHWIVAGAKDGKVSLWEVF